MNIEFDNIFDFSICDNDDTSDYAKASDLTSHTDNTSNPHKVTADQVGADPSGSASSALTSAKAYTDDAVADMVRRADSGEFDGYTPVKGKDYFTTAEIQQIQNEVSSGAIGEFKTVVDTETDRFNTNATEKVNAYNQNGSEKTASYNANATEKLNAYNTNAESKQNAYNTNASNKVTEYNSNAENKTAEFDVHTEQIQDDVNKLKSDLAKFDNLVYDVESRQLYDRNSLMVGFVSNADGKVYTGDTADTYSYTDYIDVSDHVGKIVYISRLSGQTMIAYNARSICAYTSKSELAFISESGVSSQSTFEIKDGYKYIRICVANSLKATVQAEYDGITEFAEYFEPYKVFRPVTIGNKNILMSEVASAAAGGLYEISKNIHNKKNQMISFYGEFANFDALRVGHGYNVGTYGSSVYITPTTLTIYNGTTNVATHTHGLTINEFIGVVITQGIDTTVSVTITSIDGDYTVKSAMNLCRDSVFFISSQYEMTNCKLSVKYSDMEKDIYLFGDSYTSIADSARYPFYIQKHNFNNMMMVGYGGIDSATMLPTLYSVLTMSKPKYLVWALGMNDGSDGDSYNESWKNVIDTVIELCDKYKITPIFATIPCVPTIDHTKKNAWIKSSGYRYIDFAKAVGAEEAGSTWRTGMLSSDNIHPSQLGAKALALRFMVDVPEAYES